MATSSAQSRQARLACPPQDENYEGSLFDALTRGFGFTREEAFRGSLVVNIELYPAEPGTEAAGAGGGAPRTSGTRKTAPRASARRSAKGGKRR